MNPNEFTHNFEFDLNNVRVAGELKYGIDGKISMDFKQVGIPLNSDTLQLILSFLELAQSINDVNGGVNNIKIKKKAV